MIIIVILTVILAVVSAKRHSYCNSNATAEPELAAVVRVLLGNQQQRAEHTLPPTPQTYNSLQELLLGSIKELLFSVTERLGMQQLPILQVGLQQSYPLVCDR